MKLHVSGMTCAGCAATVERALRAAPGVQSATVDFESESAVVSAKADVHAGALIDVVKGAGYQAELNQNVDTSSDDAKRGL